MRDVHKHASLQTKLIFVPRYEPKEKEKEKEKERGVDEKERQRESMCAAMCLRPRSSTHSEIAAWIARTGAVPGAPGDFGL